MQVVGRRFKWQTTKELSMGSPANPLAREAGRTSRGRARKKEEAASASAAERLRARKARNRAEKHARSELGGDYAETARSPDLNADNRNRRAPFIGI